MSQQLELIAGPAVDDERRTAAVVPLRRPHTRSDELYTSAGALIQGSDVAASPRDAARRRALAVADVLGLASSYAVVWMVQPPPASLLSRWPLLMVFPLWILLHKLLGLYDRDDKVIHKSTLDELPRLVESVTLGSLLVYAVGPMFTGVEVYRTQNLLFILIACLMVPAWRSAARGLIRRLYAPERCLVVGAGDVADMLERKIALHREYGVDLIGYVDAAYHDQGARSLRRLGGVDDLGPIASEHGVERVIVGFSSLSDDELTNVIRACKRARIKVTIVPRLFEVIGHSVEVDEIEGLTVLGLRGFSRARSSMLLKRAIDVTGALVGLILLAPVLATIAAAIKLTSRGPVFYGSQRMGRDAPFRMWKFRTMVEDADAMKKHLLHLNEAGDVMFKIADDPRITRTGRFLRKTSLDELPQLWNVLRGQMSLVGPRPLVPDEDDHVVGWHRTRLELTPGLTGPWQVMGRTAIPFQEMVKIDYLYVAEWSLWNDIRILLRTAPVVLFGRGR